MTAMSGLKGGALTHLKRLMNGKDAVDVSGWGHLVNAKYPATAQLHFMPQADWVCSRLDYSVCQTAFDKEKSKSSSPHKFHARGTGPCIVNALRAFYTRLANRESEVNQVQLPSDLKLSDADTLKYLISLVGDVHQPLHLGFVGNSLGKEITGTYKASIPGREMQRRPTTLYSYWDHDLIEKIIAERQGSWYSGWTHVNGIKGMYEYERQRFQEKKEASFDLWAEESLKVACNSIYTNPSTHQTIADGFDVDADMEAAWIELIRQRILLAGARLSIVLNDILQSREAAKLRVGSSMPGVGEEEVVPSAARVAVSSWWVRNLAINLGIVIVVLGVFAYISRYYSSGVSSARRQRGAAGYNEQNEMIAKDS